MIDIKDRLGDYHHALTSDERQIALERIEELEAEIQRLKNHNGMYKATLRKMEQLRNEAVAEERKRCISAAHRWQKQWQQGNFSHLLAALEKTDNG